MTPAEFENIKSMLDIVARNQVQFHSEMDELRESQIRHDEQIGKNTAAIGDLIVVSRTLVDSQIETEQKLQALTDNVNALSHKVNDLTDTVNRFIRHRNV